MMSLQEELEGVWNDLQMPHYLKLDMALKYSSDSYSPLLPTVSWYCGVHCFTTEMSLF